MNFKLILITALFLGNMALYDFNIYSNTNDWYIVDDVVMGGRSNGNFDINSEGHGLFSGTVSLENNGGFSSVRHQFKPKDVSDFSKIKLRIKGDGSTYQFRVKTDRRDYASYIYEFKTVDDWMTVEIPFSEMYPSFRGRRLNQPNFSGEYIAEVAFLIGNKKAQDFKLLIDKIELE
ncbi:CIA30 family protein [uncultured Psychroserpens sp.]|uniref:CIA30 family protein n=1 Tax=uncultured Psychroserpens sp. TaxID=255436 RepID=UPI00260C6944|nr:CIA30 family protein [uncultured Psychroserpens sp.]